MTKIMHGIVHGRTIELDQEVGVPDGQKVEVAVHVIPTTPPTKAGRKPGEGFLRTEGALANDPYWDEIMEQIYQERKSDTRKEFTE